MPRYAPQPHQRFAAMAGVLIVITAVVSVISYVTLGLVQRDTNHLIDRDVPAMTFLLRLDRDLTDAQLLLIEAHHHADTPKRDVLLTQFDRDVKSIAHGLERVRQISSSMATGPQLSGFERAYRQWLEAAQHARRVMAQGAPLHQRKAIVERTEAMFTPVHALAASLENELYDKQVATTSARIKREAVAARTALLWVGIGAVVLSVAASGVIAVSMRNRQRQFDRRAAEQDRYNAQQVFTGRLTKAFEMAECEEDVLRLVEEVLHRTTPGVTAELLLADSSQAHLHQVATTDSETRGPGCTVKTPRQCPAVRQGTTLSYAQSDEFDACPYLRRRGDKRCAATCVPLTIMGQTVGVLHGTAASAEVFDEQTNGALSVVAARSSERIGMLRAFTQSQTQASTDPLTGLLNRRSFQDQVAEMMHAGKPFTVAYCDLDHFKALNDKHGHDTGDRALRLFSKVLEDSIRPDDRAARWGGEEFVVALCGVGVGEALVILRRVRSALAQALSSGTMPNFTVSMGVSDTEMSEDLEVVLAAADDALLTAKHEGRDRIVVAGQAEQRHYLESELDALFANAEQVQSEAEQALKEGAEAEPAD